MKREPISDEHIIPAMVVKCTCCPATEIIETGNKDMALSIITNKGWRAITTKYAFFSVVCPLCSKHIDESQEA